MMRRLPILTSQGGLIDFKGPGVVPLAALDLVVPAKAVF